MTDPERCICVDPSPDLPGDTGVVMECPVHGEVAPPEEDDRLVPEACPHCSGLMGHYGDCPHAPAPPVEEGERGEGTDAVRADYWPGHLLGRVIDEIENSDAFDYSSVTKSNTLARLRHLHQQLPRSPDALQGEGGEA